ncbi:MAG TPA: medium chain dehydrogenase/reductase family protein [Polyangiaceae bacterium]|nr:medium chain dehydrogenase/reductase family protein [Polyangiaceae bacterium]
MRSIWIKKYGGPEVLEIRDARDPVPKAGEVRVRVRACGLNFAELMAREGLYPDAPKPPCVVGYEVAGVVDALGEGVTAPALGTRVLALTRFGGHAEAVTVPVMQTRVLPDSMSFEEGAALPVAYVTAYHMLFRVAHLREGSRVLVHMAAGGVGLAAMQLCRTVPGVVVFGTASAAKHGYLRDKGYDYCIDYRSADYATEVRRVTNGKGLDVVLDPLGGNDWKKGYDLLGAAGMLVAYGFANMSGGVKRNLFRIARNFASIPRFSPLGLMEQNRAVAGVNVGHLWNEVAMLTHEIDDLLELYRAGKINPTIDRVFKFDDVARAHHRMHERQNIGKIVLVP